MVYRIGQFENAFFNALQFVTGSGQHEHEEEIDHGRHGGFRLADADGFDDHHVEAGGLTDEKAFTRHAGHTAQGATGRGGAE